MPRSTSQPCASFAASIAISVLILFAAWHLLREVVDVLMEEGVHFQSQVLDCPAGEIHDGMPVEAIFVPVDGDITLVKFRRSGDS